MNKVVIWQMAVGTIMVLAATFAWLFLNRDPNYLIVASGTTLLGGGILYQIGQGRNGK